MFGRKDEDNDNCYLTSGWLLSEEIRKYEERTKSNPS